MDIREILRRLRAGESNGAIHRALGVHRRTVKKYRAWASEQGLLEGPLPELGELHQLLDRTLPQTPPPQNVSSVEPYRQVVLDLRREGVEVAAVYQRLKERGYAGSYASVWRFVRQLEPEPVEATVRVERQPGEEAQVDFGSAGRMVDERTGQVRKSWGFVMTLSWSRHQYVEFVFDQRVETWLACHQHAFEFFGGVPQRLVIDNLKAAVVRACWEDPLVQQSYRECAEHYGFLIAPCRPRTPQHKGKVEQGGVHYVKRNFLGGRGITTRQTANREVRQWCLQIAGQRVHGTTQEQPWVRFQTVEQAQLQALPPTPYDAGTWKLLKLHRDCHVVLDGAYYSAPFEYIGQPLRVRGGAQHVRIYTQDYQLIATHDRATQPGERHTHPDHLPQTKLWGLRLNRDLVLSQAQAVGEATGQVVQALLADPVIDRLPTAGRLLRLRDRYGAERLEQACTRALAFGDPAYLTVKRILTSGLEQQSSPASSEPLTPARLFVRSIAELIGSALGGVSWN